MTPKEAEARNDIKKLDGYDRYYVSSSGKVYTTVKGELQELKLFTVSDGYLVARLYRPEDHKRIPLKVHRLVASAFITNPLNKSDVHHIDENKQNNRVENLTWATRMENMRAGTQIQRRSKPVILTSITDGSKLYYKSTMDARRDGYGVDKVLGGRQKATKGYTVELDDPNKYL